MSHLVVVEYCPICGLPFEYCKFNPVGNPSKCKEWLEQNRPELFQEVYPEDAHEPEESLHSEEGEEKQEEEKEEEEEEETGEQESSLVMSVEDEESEEEQENSQKISVKGTSGRSKVPDISSKAENPEKSESEEDKDSESDDEEHSDDKDKTPKYPKFPACEFGLPRARPHNPPVIGIRLAKRGGKKVLTQIDGYQDFTAIDPKELCTLLRKHCSSGANLAKQTTGNTLIEVQGDNIATCRDALIKKYRIPPEAITVLAEGKKGGRKQKKPTKPAGSGATGSGAVGAKPGRPNPSSTGNPGPGPRPRNFNRGPQRTAGPDHLY